MAEAEAGFGGLLAAMPNIHWVNHPSRNASADLRPVQLSVAASCGLAVPPTLVTNDPNRAVEFCQQHQRTGVIYKPFRGGPGSAAGRPVALWAEVVGASEINESVRRTSHLFQARIPCAHAVRLTVVGRRMFGTRIDQPEGADTVDWRAAHDELRYSPIDVPDQVASSFHQMMDLLGLRFAAADLIVDPDGRWVFHGDLNPNGQWAWIQAHTGLPIAAALADELSEGIGR